MNVTIHRGGNEIGGNCIEFQNGNSSILVDIGLPISASLNHNDNTIEVEFNYIDRYKIYNGILISHAHMDHYGILGMLPSSSVVYCSNATKDLLDLNHIFTNQMKLEFDFQVFTSYKAFQCGNSR